MKTSLFLQIAVVSVAVCLGNTALAQSDIARATRQAKLQELSQRLHERDAKDYAQARAIANAAGLPIKRNLPAGGVLELQRIVPGIGPIFYLTNNLDAADTVSTDEVRPGGSAGLNLEGAGMTVAEWDGGAVYPDHTDFIGRLTQMDVPEGVSGHSTHVAGTLIGAGDGLEPRSRGMASAAQLEAWDWNYDSAEMAAEAAGGLLISNHSYGIAAGWLYVGGSAPDTWWWVGGTADTDLEDPNFGYYDTQSQLWDQIAYDAPYYLIVKAAGNDRTDTGPSPGEQYWVVGEEDGVPVKLFTSTVPRPFDCAPAGYDCMPTNAVAKNVLTVGAVDDVYGGYSPLAGPSQVQMSPFSSWGPSDDGRIKPDIVGNGVFLISAWPDSPYYAAAAGTSMAAPNVTGSLLLLQEHFEDINGPGNFMRSATLKALAIHTTDESGDADGPDYEFGWGLLNTKKAAEVITEDGGDHQVIEGSLANGATDSVPVNVADADSQVTATLVWTDPPGTPVAPSLDPPDLMLVNDLDLRITDGGTTYLPWVLDPANPAAAATKGDNFRDNVEQVNVVGIGPGLFTVEVSHKGALQGGLNQDYALIISVEAAPPTGSGLLLSEDFSGGFPAGWSLDTNTNPYTNWFVMTPAGDGSRFDNLTGGSGQFAMVDFSYYHEGAASLRTPVLDLSANNAAVLRFNSQHNYDTWETLNVDTSIDGGFSWSNQWSFQGFNPFPTLNSIDLSAALAGQPNVMLRFRYDSWLSYSGDYWQIDDVELEVYGGSSTGDPPAAADSPNPSHGAIDVPLNFVLDWNAGTGADSHDVYFGTDPTPDAGEFQVNQPGTGFDPVLANDVTYYWRIDEVNTNGTTTGSVWNFTTEVVAPPPPTQAVHLADLQGTGLEAPKGRWEAVVSIMVEDGDGLQVSGVLAEGAWSNGTNGGVSCTTDGSGACSVIKPNLKNNVASVDFTVNNLTLDGYSYDSGANEVAVSVTVLKPSPNLLPSAVDDNFSTQADTLLVDNVMANDDPGDAPATVTAFDAISSEGFMVSVAADGDFSYTPSGGYAGADSFGYTITDSNGDSDSASVNITVGSAPPPPPANRSVTAVKSKQKGNNIVTLSWSGFSDASVTISRNTELQETVLNALGAWQDNLGKHPASTYTYEVCEAGPSSGCASDSVNF
ncbi:MAG: S8 family serine peptidase [Gammaproteobacteria bacterium]|nr:S8 family serine peptidase [Gammaproteobacteria bacterium]